MSTDNRQQNIENEPKNLLKELGFDERQAEVYLEVMQSGKISPSEIAKKHRDIPRSSVYDILSSLQNQGFVTTVQESGKLLFQTQGIEHVIDVLEDEKRTVEEKQRKLRTAADAFAQIQSGSAYQPAVRHFEGKNGLVAMQREIANVRTALYTIVDMTAVAKTFPRTIFQDNLKDLYLNKIEKHDLMVRSPEAETYLKTAMPTTFHRIKWLPADVEFQTDTLVWDGHVAIMDYSGTPSGVIIDNPAIYKTFHAWFEMMWNSIKEEVK